MIDTATPDAKVSHLELELLSDAVGRRYGHDLSNYDRDWLERCLERLRVSENARTLTGLQERLLHDPGAIDRLMAALARPSVSHMGPTSLYRALRSLVMGRLRTYPSLRVWVVGGGDMAWSIALLFATGGLLDRVRIYATEPSDQALLRSSRQRLSADAEARMRADENGTWKDLDRWFERDPDGTLRPSDELDAAVTFGVHNPLSDQSLNAFHLIVARGGLEPLSASSRNRVLRLFYGSLVPFGYLALGGRDTLPPGWSHLLEPVDRRARLHRALPDVPGRR